jgi:pyrroline-5-carboxylate reductase
VTKKLAIVGAGMMGEALARGLFAAGWTPDDLVLADIRSDRLEEIGSALNVETSNDSADASGRAAGVLLAVKPQDAATALQSVSSSIGPSGLVSIVAGLSTASIEEHLGHGSSVVRAMPNTPARVGKGVTALATGSHAAKATRNLAEAVFSAVGPVVWLDEEQLDAVTALSGSGPAYVFYLAEAMVEAAIELGLPKDVAETLAYATIEGAGVMLQQTGEQPAVLRQQVTSPGGTTAAAIDVLETKAVRRSIGEALLAARDRSLELGGGSSKR